MDSQFSSSSTQVESSTIIPIPIPNPNNTFNFNTSSNCNSNQSTAQLQDADHPSLSLSTSTTASGCSVDCTRRDSIMSAHLAESNLHPPCSNLSIPSPVSLPQSSSSSSSSSTSSGSRRTSSDSFDSSYSATLSTATTLTGSSLADSVKSNPPSITPNHSLSTIDKNLLGWKIDERFGAQEQTRSSASSSYTVWKPTRSAPLPLPQHEPRRTAMRVEETSTSYEILVELPSFVREAITVAQRRGGRAIYIVADQLEGPNAGHFERLVRLASPDHYSDYHIRASAATIDVSSSFDAAKGLLSISVIKPECTTRRYHAVVCDNGSGLTGNKTYRLFL